MKKAFLSIVLASLSLGAIAKWEKVDETPKKESMYLNAESIKKTGTIASAWVLTDSPKPIGNGEFSGRSSKTFYEFDCEMGRGRAQQVIMFSGQMGNGKTVLNMPIKQPFSPLDPDSILKAVQKRACK